MHANKDVSDNDLLVARLSHPVWVDWSLLAGAMTMHINLKASPSPGFLSASDRVIHQAASLPRGRSYSPVCE